MATQQQIEKTDLIKFNVSPQFKKLASQKAVASGMNLSELGRMLFGMYIHNFISPTQNIDTLAQQAQKNYKKNIGKSFTNTHSMTEYLENL